MCDCDYDPPQFFTETLRHARREYQCYECRRTIRRDELHEVVSGKWDGSFSVFRTCIPCVILWESVIQETKCCKIYGTLREEIENIVYWQDTMARRFDKPSLTRL
jgi:hypothetical protein